MNLRKPAWTLFVAVLLLAAPASIAAAQEPKAEGMKLNPVSYFEIPVSDMDRAVAFYEAVFSVTLDRTVVDGHEMALFSFNEEGKGISGALAKGESYVPSPAGPRIYFAVKDIDTTLQKAVQAGGKVAYTKTQVGSFWVAEFTDSEGNQIALSAAAT